MQQAQQGEAFGESWLFFGCRSPEEDCLYGDELAEFETDGTLGHLEIAFSRAGPEKVYVQHLLQRHVCHCFYRYTLEVLHHQLPGGYIPCDNMLLMVGEGDFHADMME